MKFKQIAIAAVLASSATAMSFSAQAGVEILDAWQMNLPGYSTTSNIGHLVVSGGQTTVTQQLNASGDIFVGARFDNFGGLFSITYTPENCTGGCDFGAPGGLPTFPLSIEYNFSGLKGTVKNYNAGTGEIDYVFDAGVGSAWLNISGESDILATFTPTNPSGGSLANFYGAVNTSGTSNLIFKLTSVSDPARFLDKDGNNLLPQDTFFSIDTTNQIFAPASAAAPCGDFGGGLCSTLVVTQQGKIDALLRGPNEIPEPGTLALLALGVLGIGAATRRRG